MNTITKGVPFSFQNRKSALAQKENVGKLIIEGSTKLKPFLLHSLSSFFALLRRDSPSEERF